MRTWQRVTAAVLVAVVAAAGIGVGFRTLAADAEPKAVPAARSVTVRTTIAPRELHFGDTVDATLVVTVDRARVDPDTVRVAPSFEAYRALGPPVRARSDGAGTTTLATMYRLLCVTGQCTPTQGVLHEQFEPVTVAYRDRATGDEATLEAPWRPFLVRTRLDAQIARDQPQGDGTFSNSSPWRAELTAVPAVSYRVSPSRTRWVLLAASVLFALAGAVLVYLALPRWVPRAEPEPEPEPEPDPVPPLEQALEVLESPVETNGSSGRRRALELVADAVAGWGETDLAHSARTLAWSEEAPTAADTRSLAALVRVRLEQDANGVPA